MKFFIDNNLPPALARALHELSAKRAEVAVTHLREKFHAGTPDIEWVNMLAHEGDWAVVSLDRFRKGSAEKLAFRKSGLTVFYLPKQWTKQDYWEIAHRLVRWWPHIIRQAEMIQGGGAFEVPWKISGQARMKQIQF